MPCPFKSASPFHCFNSSLEVIRLVVVIYVKYALLRGVEGLLHERGIDISHETVQLLVEQTKLAYAGSQLRTSGPNLC